MSLTANTADQKEPAPIVQEEIVQDEILDDEDQLETLEEILVCDKCPKGRILKDQNVTTN